MLLEIRELHVDFEAGAVCRPVLVGVDLSVADGQTVALVGESGSGKTVTALSVLRLLPQPPARIVRGSILFCGRDLLALSPRELRAVRGNRVAMVFQEPMSSLNPVLTIGQQIGEVLRIHRPSGGRAIRERTVELLRLVGLPEPHRCRRQYPHELSGGMQQRAMIAMALACEPGLLIADEPTSALDVVTQRQVLSLLHELRRARRMGLLLIAHDLAVVAEMADSVCVLYSGRVIERAATHDLLAHPRHPYTQELLRCRPGVGLAPTKESRPARRLPAIPGEAPDPATRPAGCAFHPRCRLAGGDPNCRTRVPPWRWLSADQGCACWKADGSAGDASG